MSQDKPSQEQKQVKRYFYFPKNANLILILERNLNGLWPTVKDMLQTKDYARGFSVGDETIEFIAQRGEDIAKGVIERANPRELAICGSDFVLENILDPDMPSLSDPTNKKAPFYRFRKSTRGYTEIWAHEKGTITPAVDLGDIVGRDIPAGYPVKFESEDRMVEMRVLQYNYDVPPRLCLLGPENSDYQSLIKMAKALGIPLRFIFEIRLRRTDRFFLDGQKSKCGFNYEEMPVTGTTEGLVYLEKGPLPPNKAHMALDIGQTFSTARQNEIKPYVEIMQTYPVEVVCYRKDSQEKPINLAELKRKFKTEADSPSVTNSYTCVEKLIGQETPAR